MTTTTTPSTDAARTSDSRSARRFRLWVLPAALALMVAVLLGGLVLGRGTAAGPERVTDPASLGFVRDMHQAQAVRMSEIAHRRTDIPSSTTWPSTS